MDRTASRSKPAIAAWVTALFADLVDYVRMIAEHDPEVVRLRVRTALARMAEAIERVEGTREKFIGDGAIPILVDAAATALAMGAPAEAAGFWRAAADLASDPDDVARFRSAAKAALATLRS